MAGRGRRTILETGRPSDPGPRSACRRSAFTLIEMILVMALLVVAVSMVSPRLSDFLRGRAIESEARRLLAVTHAARSRAITEGLPVLVWLDSGTGTYGLERVDAGRSGDPQARQFDPDDQVRVSFDRSQRLIGQTATGVPTPTVLPGQSGLRRTPVSTTRQGPSIRWDPDGTIDEDSPNAIRVEDAGGAVLWLVEASNRRHYEIRTTLD
ncbi:MAG: Tfp pilus assembly protein FimT/FimU [Verrucomicrobiota bacterium]